MVMMYGGYSYPVEAVEPSGIVGTSSGKLSATRRFKVPCKYAESFALRMMGKYRGEGEEIYDSPMMPAPFPYYSAVPQIGNGFFNLLASDFRIDPADVGCFNNLDPESLTGRNISNPIRRETLERYWFEAEEPGDEPLNDGSLDSCGCLCIVTIVYTESPCDCFWDIEGGPFEEGEGLEWVFFRNILTNTCVSTERNPSYEMYTLPNRTLYWADLLSQEVFQCPGSGSDELSEEEIDRLKVDKQLKGDSYAYQIIPKADITVSWHFVPVKYLCLIEAHLVDFRGHVNMYAWGSVLNCNASLDGNEDDPDGSSSESSTGVCLYEPETLLFVDYAEDRSRRTTGYIGMDTTTLKLTFKQKRIFRPQNNDVVGWNHLFTDRNRAGDQFSPWQRVAVDVGGGSFENLFTKKDFTNILNPTIS